MFRTVIPVRRASSSIVIEAPSPCSLPLPWLNHGTYVPSNDVTSGVGRDGSAPRPSRLPGPFRDRASPRARKRLGQLPKPLGLGQLLQLLERVVLDLPDALARDAEGATHLLERQRLVPAQSVPQLDHLALPLRQRVEGPLDVLTLEAFCRRVEGLLGAVVADEVAELRLLPVPDGLLERDRHLRNAQDVADLADRGLQLLGDLGRLRLTTHPLHELALNMCHAVQLLDPVHGDPERASLVGDRPGHRLA